ncbi:MAG: hypothetical protein IPK50_11910 [Fibrobacterota bacterium]|nr:MAG: hypothetical protein IPK50_11910 [Fibrobacterota bacterium]
MGRNDFRCLELWSVKESDFHPRYLVRWDSTGNEGTLVAYGRQEFDADMQESKRSGIPRERTLDSVGSLRLRVNGQDTTLELELPGVRSMLRRGPCPTLRSKPIRNALVEGSRLGATSGAGKSTGCTEPSDRWLRDSVVLGSWVDSGFVDKKRPLNRKEKGALTWVHLGPTADCPHMLPVLPDFSCMDHWTRSSNDDEPELGIRWDSTGWGAEIVLYRWVIFLDRKTGNGSDSVEGPRVVGHLRVLATPADTALEVRFHGRRTKMVRGALPDAYEGNIEPPDLEEDRLWFDSLHRSALMPVRFEVPEPVRCLLSAHADSSKTSVSRTDINCLKGGSATQDSFSRTWSDPAGRWEVRRIFITDTSEGRFKDEIRFRFPDHWNWIWWERREKALKTALDFVTGTSPHRSMAMENPRLQFSTKEGACHISGRSDHGTDPWFTLDVHCP